MIYKEYVTQFSYLLNRIKLENLEDWRENQNQVFNFTKTKEKTK